MLRVSPLLLSSNGSLWNENYLGSSFQGSSNIGCLVQYGIDLTGGRSVAVSVLGTPFWVHPPLVFTFIGYDYHYSPYFYCSQRSLSL